MLVVSAQMCMAINLYKECRGTSDKECQLINQVVINRMQKTSQDACSVIFERGQFSWTNGTQKKLKFNSYQEMISYYKINEPEQLIRAFSNVEKSQINNEQSNKSVDMTHYYDKSLRLQPKWAKKMTVAYSTKHFVFYNA